MSDRSLYSVLLYSVVHGTATVTFLPRLYRSILASVHSCEIVATLICTGDAHVVTSRCVTQANETKLLYIIINYAEHTEPVYTFAKWAHIVYEEGKFVDTVACNTKHSMQTYVYTIASH